MWRYHIELRANVTLMSLLYVGRQRSAVSRTYGGARAGQGAQHVLNLPHQELLATLAIFNNFLAKVKLTFATSNNHQESLCS